MAFGEPSHGQRQAADDTVPAHSLRGIGRTGRIKAASLPKERTQYQLIGSEESQHTPRREAWLLRQLRLAALRPAKPRQYFIV